MKKICKLLTILSAAITMFASFATAQTAPVKYVFLMIGDGMGPNQREIAEKYSLSEYGRKLPMNHLEYSSRTTTHSANKPVTDSSASGTAIACGENRQRRRRNNARRKTPSFDCKKRQGKRQESRYYFERYAQPRHARLFLRPPKIAEQHVRHRP